VKLRNLTFITTLGLAALCLAPGGGNAAALLPQQPAPSASSPAGPSAEDNLAKSGFDRFYNLDYERAIRDFETDLKAHPDDPFALNHLLTARLFHELYGMGVLDTGYYSNNSFIGQPHRKPDPKEQEQIKELINRALKLEDDRLEHESNDVQTLYARGVTRGLRATYTALVERSWFAALRSALARDKTRTQVFDISELGLVEMTRKRVSEGLVESLSSTCAVCGGRGIVLDESLL